MIKYEICKVGENDYSMTFSDPKIVSRKSLKNYKSEGWKVRRKIYPLITPLSDWWSKLSMGHRLTIIGMIVGTITSIALFTSEHVFSQKYTNLKSEFDSLNLKHNLLIEEYNFLLDSCKTTNDVLAE